MWWGSGGALRRQRENGRAIVSRARVGRWWGLESSEGKRPYRGLKVDKGVVEWWVY